MADYIDRQKIYDITHFMEDDVLRQTIERIVEGIPAADVIPLGVEMWADRFDFRTKQWISEDNTGSAVSFVITRREREDEQSKRNHVHD